MIKQKFKEWIKRYLPSEIIGTTTALTAASIAHLFYKNPVFIAYAGSLGEAIGFYSTVFIQNIIASCKKNKITNRHLSFSGLIKIISHILLEFGPAGIIDGVLLRPMFMYVFPIYLKNFPLGILAGKIAGDITFYILVILSYEIKNKKLNGNKI
jgi:hypothetical protein